MLLGEQRVHVDGCSRIGLSRVKHPQLKVAQIVLISSIVLEGVRGLLQDLREVGIGVIFRIVFCDPLHELDVDGERVLLLGERR